jgi:hypothetical protein
MNYPRIKAKIISLILGILLIGFSSSNVPNAVAQGDDKDQIINLVREVYEWQETNKYQEGMVFLKSGDGNTYIGLDLDGHNLWLDGLRKTNYFSEEFLNNLKRIALTLDNKLRTKELEYLVGYMPPFGIDANAWCKCQDYPNDTWWETIQVTFISMENESATIIWTWGDQRWSKDFEYKVKVIKANGLWQISYLEGFDFDTFTRKNY